MRTMRLIIVVLFTLAATMHAGTVDPFEIVQSRLEKLHRQLPVTYRTNSSEVYCTIHCRDADEKGAVYDAFRNVQTLGLSSRSQPPIVCVVLLFDPISFQAQRMKESLEANLSRTIQPISGKVIQKVPEGLIVSHGDYLVLVADAPAGLVDDDGFDHVCYWLGEDYQYGAKTIRKLTGSRAAAEQRWSPVSAAQARSETEKRVAPR